MAARFARTLVAAAIAVAVLTAWPVGSVAAASTPPVGGTGTSITTPTATVGSAAPGEVRIAPAYDPGIGVATVGPLPPDSSLNVAVGLASRNPTGLAAAIAAASIPGSSTFHRPLSAALSAREYGATAIAVANATSYFESYGLSVTSNPDGLVLDVIGSSAAIARAFDTTFEEYRAPNGSVFWNHPTPAELPSVAPWSGVLGLSDDAGAEPLVRAAPSTTVTPAASCTSNETGGLLPCAIQGAYNITSVIDSGNNGSGYRIAVVDAYSGEEPQTQLASDLRAFDLQNDLPTSGVSFLYPVPYSGVLNSTSTNPGWGLEDSLDIEWARAVAPDASLEMTFSPNSGAGLYEAIDWLVGHGAADVISLSWGEPDVGVFNAYDTPCTSACNASTDGTYAILGPVLELAAVEGITVFAASGDCGAADGTSGVATNFPASDPYVTGVGGTMLTLAGADDNEWFAESGWGGNSSGATSPGCENQGGSGGGYSILPRPYWQTGLPTGTHGRGVPDVAMDARTAVQIIYQGEPEPVIGTSVGTPIWAGIGALADGYAGGDLGLLDPSIYRILNTPSEYSADFHDITTGNNGYAAGVGWDPVTGAGTPKVNALLPDLTRGGGAAGGDLAVALSGTPTSGAAPLPVTFTVTPSGGSGTYPVYGVSYGNGNATLATSSSVDYTYPTAGVYTAQAFAYDSSGNATISSPVTIVVGGGATLSVTLAVSDGTPTEAMSVNFSASVSGGSGPYLYNFSFGDGAFTENGSAATVAHTYCSAGSFDAYVVVRSTGHPAAGGESLPVTVTVANGTGSSCPQRPSPLSLVPTFEPTVRDAPADFPSLFTASGGSGSTTIVLSSTTAYTGDCQCTIFPVPGNYTVVAEATDSAGRTANATVNVTVLPALVGTFSSSALAGPAPLTVDFGVSVTGGDGANAANTVWTDGIGDTSTGATAAFTYHVPGEYLAVGRLSDLGDGNTSEAFLVDVEPATGAPPIGATATIEPAQDVSSGVTVNYTATPIGANASDVVYWSLDDLGAAAYGATANQSYTTSSLLALPNDELEPELSILGSGDEYRFAYGFELWQFFANESGGFTPAISDLDLVAETLSDFGVAPYATQFSNFVTGPGVPTVAWSFGDGTGTTDSTDLLVDHTYSQPGNYTAQARATDPPYGDSLVASMVVQVSRPLVLTASVSPLSGIAPLRVTGSANSSGGVGPPFQYSWYCGGFPVNGNGVSINCTISHPGTFEIEVEASSGPRILVREYWNVTASYAPGLTVAVIGAGVGTGIVLAVVLGRPGRRRRSPSP